MPLNTKNAAPAWTKSRSRQAAALAVGRVHDWLAPGVTANEPCFAATLGEGSARAGSAALPVLPPSASLGADVLVIEYEC